MTVESWSSSSRPQTELVGGPEPADRRNPTVRRARCALAIASITAAICALWGCAAARLELVAPTSSVLASQDANPRPPSRLPMRDSAARDRPPRQPRFSSRTHPLRLRQSGFRQANRHRTVKRVGQRDFDRHPAFLAEVTRTGHRTGAGTRATTGRRLFGAVSRVSPRSPWASCAPAEPSAHRGIATRADSVNASRSGRRRHQTAPRIRVRRAGTTAAGTCANRR